MTFQTIFETFFPLIFIGTEVCVLLLVALLWPWPPQEPKEDKRDGLL